MEKEFNCQRTLRACHTGYVVQAVVNNFSPLLFAVFSSGFGIELSKITSLIILNFMIQLLIDALSAKFIDVIGYKKAVIAADIFAAAGLLCLGILPYIITPYYGIVISVVIYAIGGGLIEVVISPIVEACPIDNKDSAMSFLHSFYCWGHVGVVIVSSVFFKIFNINNWNILACLWALLPITNAIMFSKAKVYEFKNEYINKKAFTNLFRQGTFWLIIILMICAGAAEQAMSQWVSVFAEKGLGISKMSGDIMGTCMFALLMGCSRFIYSQINIKLNKYILFSALLCAVCYLVAGIAKNPFVSLIACAICGFSVGIMWPGTYSFASQICGGTTALFALMALGGDLGCSVGPAFSGFISDIFGENLKIGMTVSVIFPILILIIVFFMNKKLQDI